MSFERILLGVLAAVFCAGAGICFGEPVINVEPNELNFSAFEWEGNPEAQTLYISNGGTGKLEWEITEDCEWLSVEPVSGTSFGEDNEVTISVDISGLGGEYTYDLVITDPDASNNPQVVEVNLSVDVLDEGLWVPYEYATIQEAIDAAKTGDEVIIADGVYSGFGNCDFYFWGKAITVRSQNGPESCIIEVGFTELSVCNFISEEGSDSVLKGITITNAITEYGGAIYCYDSSPTIIDCRFINNSAFYEGGAVHCYDSSMNLVNCVFLNNQAYFGGGIRCFNGSPTITNCTFVGNSSDYGGGAINNGWGTLKVHNCIFRANAPNQINWATVKYSNIEGGYEGEGNIDVDPMFVDINSEEVIEWDLRLRPESLCVDSGTNSPSEGLPSTDIDGNPRIIDGDNDGTAIIDMGAYEQLPLDEPAIRVSTFEVEIKAIEGGANPEAQILEIRNSGGGVLEWEITEESDWLNVSPESGSSSGETNEVFLTADTNDISVGVYSCELKIDGADAVNGPLIVIVTLRVAPDDDYLWVPYDYGNIKAAVGASLGGDVIVIADGVYNGPANRGIEISDKSITIRSENGPQRCIIDGEYAGRLFYIDSCSSILIGGLTITRGYWMTTCTGGAAIACRESGISVYNCIISDNYSELDGTTSCFCYGGAIYIDWKSKAIISNCIISDNGVGSWGWGGGICCEGISGNIIRDSIFYNNQAIGHSSEGGAIYDWGTYTKIINCTIVGNEATDWGGGLAFYGSDTKVYNSIIVGNSPDQIYAANEENCSVIRCVVEGGWGLPFPNANFDIDPNFVSPEENDFHLSWESPCIDLGIPVLFMGTKDIDGEPRTMGDYVDIGADEVGEKQADFTRDGRIDVSDLVVLSGSWGTQEGGQRWYVLSDLWEDGIIGLDDLAVFVGDWMWIADWAN